MANRSGGTPPAPQPIADANHAMAMLAMMHHWSVRRMNRGEESRVQVTIQHAGLRVQCERATFPAAVQVALRKLNDKAGPRLRLTD